MLLQVVIAALFFFSRVNSHSQLLCTDLETDSNGNPTACRGWMNFNRPYYFALNSQKPSVFDPSWKLPQLGQLPPINMLGRVTPGQTVKVLNTVNNHLDDRMALYREPFNDAVPYHLPSGNSADGFVPLKPQTSMKPWFDDKNLIAPPTTLYTDEKHCKKVKQADTSFLGQLIIQHVHNADGVNMSQDVVCWREITIPKDWKPGLHRVLYFGNRKATHPAEINNPNMWWYWDVFWYNVVAGNKNTNDRPSLAPLNFPQSVTPSPFKTAGNVQYTYTRVYLNFKYSTPTKATITVKLLYLNKMIGAGNAFLYSGNGNVEISAFAELNGVRSFVVEANLIDPADNNRILSTIRRATINVK